MQGQAQILYNFQTGLLNHATTDTKKTKSISIVTSKGGAYKTCMRHISLPSCKSENKNADFISPRQQVMSMC
jgi:hypothetical protein